MRSRTRPRNRSALALRLTAASLAITAALSGTSALADHGKYRDGYRPHDRTYDRPFHAGERSVYRESVRVHIPVRDHGPETLPLGRLIRQNSGLDMNDYRLVAVVVRNGRWSHGYASLRTGNRKSGRYLLDGGSKTRIPAPSRADRKWRLRLGPGTQVRSITAILEPRRSQWSQTSPQHWKESAWQPKRHDRYRDQAASHDRRRAPERREGRASERRS